MIQFGRIRVFVAVAAGWLAPALYAAPWPAVDSDLPADPALVTGTLRNGVRYFFLPSTEPKGRISLRLVVAVGAMHENDDELGLAHFVEHMAFRGTRSHPDGTLTELLQKLGVGFGPDSTAFTFYDHTQYHLELPDAAEGTLRAGLGVLREYASEVTFVEPLLERERGVVLSELATRDSPGIRSALYNQAVLWPRSRPTRRPIGGTAESIRRLTRDQFIAFYDAWYRPERIAIVATGDVAAATVVGAIEQEFSSLQARAPARPEPADFAPATADPPWIELFSDPGLVGIWFGFQHPIHTPPAPDTHARRITELRRYLAMTMWQARLQQIAHRPEAAILSPQVQLAQLVPHWQLASVTVSSKITDWGRVAGELENEHRRAMQYGFTEQELAEMKASFLSRYEQAERSAPTRRSDELANQVAAALTSGVIFTTPAAIRRDVAADLAATTLRDCLDAFRDTWTTRTPHVYIASHPSFAITRQQVVTTLNANRQTAVRETETTSLAAFGYSSRGSEGRLAKVEHLPDLDVRLARFENGVRLNFKPTQFEANIVDIEVRVGTGKLGQPRNRPGLDLLANFAVTAGGLGQHTAQELARLLAGRPVQVAFRADTDAFIFSARSAPKEIGFACELIAAFLTDAAFRPELMRDATASFNSMFAAAAASPGGILSIAMFRELTGDSRFGMPLPDELHARKLEELKAWLEPEFRKGAMEISIVGDVGWDDASRAVARTLGAMPTRGNPPARSLGTTKPGPVPKQPKLFFVDPQVRQSAIAWLFPVATDIDIRAERRCRLLAAVLGERLRVRIRDELGAAYVTNVTFNTTKGFPLLNFFSVYAELDPARASQAMQIVQREAASLAAGKIDDEEFNRVKQPFLRQRADDLSTNAYWGGTVLSDAQQHPERITAARTRHEDTTAITLADLLRFARRYLDPAKGFRFTTMPGAVPQTPTATPGANSGAAKGKAGR